MEELVFAVPTEGLWKLVTYTEEIPKYNIQISNKFQIQIFKL
jgi:hypothetical protein